MSAVAAPWRAWLDDERGLEHVEVLIVVAVLAFGGMAAFQALGSSIDDAARRAGDRVLSLEAASGGATPPEAAPITPGQPPPTTAGEPTPPGPPDENPSESPSGGSDDDYYGTDDSYGGSYGGSNNSDSDPTPPQDRPPPDPEDTIIDGSEDSGNGWVSVPSEVRTAGFVARHPIAAGEIGEVESGSTNISTNAVRFATNDLGLEDNDAREGSQVNAFRHVLWQATIAERFGTDIAAEAANAHEDNPNALNRFDDPNGVRFTTSALADESADLLNNRIGRSIGESSQSGDMNQIALEVLDYYHEQGLWVATQESDGTYSISQQRLTEAEYAEARARLLQLNELGYAPGQEPR